MMDQLEVRPISTDGAAFLCFSPDGQWIAYMTGGQLKKIAVAGGPAQTLADAPAKTHPPL